jgi:hypothetical protein
MPTITFRVTGVNTANNTVTMTLNGNPATGDLTVDIGTVIQWNLTRNVDNILITQSSGPGNTNIWSSVPAPFPLPTSRNWQGTIGNAGNIGESYTITGTAGGTTVSHDPRISVNPPNLEDVV